MGLDEDVWADGNVSRRWRVRLGVSRGGSLRRGQCVCWRMWPQRCGDRCKRCLHVCAELRFCGCVLRVLCEVVRRCPASQRHAAVGHFRGRGKQAPFPLWGRVDGDAGRARLLLSLPAAD